VVIEGQGDIADICRLTCLEENVQVVPASAGESLPRLEVIGTKVFLRMDAEPEK
jgi:hypothetical protein